jgi:hypothetical protein
VDWKKLALVFSGSFVVAGLSVAAALAPMFSDRPEIIGYWGGVAGGLAGGAMTLAAGWLAWTAAQHQIASQQTLLELTADEHRKRSVRLLRDVVSQTRTVVTDTFNVEKKVRPLVRLNDDGVLTRRMALRIDVFPVIRGLERALGDTDLWRLDFALVEDMQRLQSMIENFNSFQTKNTRIGLVDSISPDVIPGMIRDGAYMLRHKADREMQRLVIIEHSEARQ